MSEILILSSSGHTVGHLRTAENMKMKVMNGLAGIGTAV